MSPIIREFLKMPKIQKILKAEEDNNLKFKKLFEEASKILSFFQMKELFQILQNSGLSINEKDALPKEFKIYKNFVDKRVKLKDEYIQNKIEEVKNSKHASLLYSLHLIKNLNSVFNVPGTIINFIEIDPEKPELSTWVVKFDNGVKLIDIPYDVLIFLN